MQLVPKWSPQQVCWHRNNKFLCRWDLTKTVDLKMKLRYWRGLSEVLCIKRKEIEYIRGNICIFQTHSTVVTQGFNLKTFTSTHTGSMNKRIYSVTPAEYNSTHRIIFWRCKEQFNASNCYSSLDSIEPWNIKILVLPIHWTHPMHPVVAS